ncbi:Uncharacterised protein [Vibrio cholerae]|nr:Uncharacterised protein [Vibrio cholerae]
MKWQQVFRRWLQELSMLPTLPKVPTMRRSQGNKSFRRLANLLQNWNTKYHKQNKSFMSWKNIVMIYPRFLKSFVALPTKLICWH